MDFNTFSLTNLVGTLSDVIGARRPENAKGDVVAIKEIVDKKAGGRVDRMLLYNPDAVGEWIYEKYYDLFYNVRKYTDVSVDFLTAFPPKTPVCFATMYTGAEPAVHGITRYEKPVLKVDTFFDALPDSGKKVAMVAVANQSIPRIFAERDIDYYLMKYDDEVVEKALELIAEDKYDVIEVYNQEYDDKMHRSWPTSRIAVNALRHYNASFGKLMEAVSAHWKDHDTLVAFSTDHGVHKPLFGLGAHGKNIPKDMNIRHFFGVLPKQK